MRRCEACGRAAEDGKPIRHEVTCRKPDVRRTVLVDNATLTLEGLFEFIGNVKVSRDANGLITLTLERRGGITERYFGRVLTEVLERASEGAFTGCTVTATVKDGDL